MVTKAGVIQTRYSQSMAYYQTPLQRLAMAVGLAALAAGPMYLSAPHLDLAITILLAVPAALALNLLTGVAGQVSIGHAAFLATGAFAAAACARSDLPIALIFVVSPVGAALVGAIVALPGLRLRGLYLVMSTLALHYVIVYVARIYQTDRVGEFGFRMPLLTPFGEDAGQSGWYWLLLIVSVVGTVGYANLLRTRFGRAWKMIRDKDIAAEILGVNVTRYKVAVFALTSGVAGFQGVLLAYYLGSVQVDGFNLDLAISYIAMIVIGGMGSLHGAIFGAILVLWVPVWVTDLTLRVPPDSFVGNLLATQAFNISTVGYGVAIVGFLCLEPRGLAHIWARIRQWFALWPFSRERA